jgi:hypothetical protein
VREASTLGVRNSRRLGVYVVGKGPGAHRVSKYNHT